MSTGESSLGVVLESDAFDTSDLRVIAFEGREAISELFHFDVDLVCVGDRSVTEQLVPNQPLTLALSRDGTVVRRFHGVIASVRQRLDEGDGRQRWSVRIVPRAARLDLVASQTIYLGGTVPEILRQKLDAVGFVEDRDVTYSLLGDYPTLDLVVQFAETDLAFVSRRAEHLGISYFFVADDEKRIESMRFVDHAAGFPELAGGMTARIGVLENVVERIERLEREQTIVPNLYRIEDHNYRSPMVRLGEQKTLEGGVGGTVEFGAHVKSREEAAALAAIRIEEHACRRNVYRGESTIPLFSAGHRVKVEEHGELPEVELLLVAVEHRATLPLGAAGEAGDGAAPAGYHNRFEAVGTEHTFRPERLTPRPKMPSFVTGVVQPTPGSHDSGATAALDAEGRYWVQLHFETVLGKPRDQASHPLRMMQPYGGSGHGMHFPLRPGTEVVVGFANGDPDRPLILGAVPNAVTRSPVTGVDPRRNRIVTRMGVAFEIGERE